MFARHVNTAYSMFHRFYEAVIHIYKNKKVPGEIGDGPGWP